MVGTYAQDARALTDSISNFKKDIYYAGCTTTTTLPLLRPPFSWHCCLGSNQNDSTLVDLFANKSTSLMKLLNEELGITLTDLVHSSGHSVARTHKPPDWPTGDSQPIGRLLVNQVSFPLDLSLSPDPSLYLPLLSYCLDYTPFPMSDCSYHLMSIVWLLRKSHLEMEPSIDK
jgi:hypothetical protein